MVNKKFSECNSTSLTNYISIKLTRKYKNPSTEMNSKLSLLSIRFGRKFSTTTPIFAGHAKWQNIKHRKERQDASRSAQNTKMAHKIYIAAKEGGSPDPLKNFRLAMIIESATRASVPKKVIEAAVSRAEKSSTNPADNALSMTYEGMGPGGVAFVVEALTDNKNRTAQQIRAMFQKYKGSLSPTLYMFDRKGWIELPKENITFDNVFDTCADTEGVDDIDEDETTINIYTDPTMLNSVATDVKKYYKISNMGLTYLPKSGQETQMLSSETLGKLENFIIDLEELDDISEIYSNYVRS